MTNYKEILRSLCETEVARKLYPATSMGRQYKMPDYEYIHQETQKSGVTLYRSLPESEDDSPQCMV